MNKFYFFFISKFPGSPVPRVLRIIPKDHPFAMSVTAVLGTPFKNITEFSYSYSAVLMPRFL